MEKTIFDLVEVKFGDKVTTARPYEFEQDKKGNFIKAIKAITTCPNCGHGEVVNLDDGLQVKCSNCNFGSDKYFDRDPSLYSEDVIINNAQEEIINLLEDRPAIKVNSNTSTITIDKSNDVQSLVSNCPFIDPIEIGLFTKDEI